MKPPALATSLLERLTGGDKRDSVIGDLVEQYQNGRSRGWSWRQTLVAITASVWTDLRDHPFFALRTFLISAVVLLGMRNLRNVIWNSVGNAISVPIGNWLLINDHHSARSWWFAWHLYDLPRFGLWWLVCLLYGGMVVGLHRSHRPTVAILCAASAIANVTWWLTIYFSQLLDAPPYVRPFLLASIANSVCSVACVFVGGMWMAASSRSESPAPVAN